MKILVVTNLYPPGARGGYEMGCRQAVDALRGRGHDALVLTSAAPVLFDRAPHVRRVLNLTDLWDPRQISRTTALTEQLAWSDGILVDCRNVHALMETLDEFRPDVVYLWNLIGLGGLALVRCLRGLGVPWVWHLMDDVPVVLSMPTPRGRHRALLRAFNRTMRGSFLLCSRQIADEIAEAGITLAGPVEVVPNWVAGPVPPGRTRGEVGRRLRIIYAGQVARHKGVDILINSAALLRERGYGDFEIDLYGTPADDTFAAQIAGLGLEDHVRLRGMRAQSELAELYGDYDVFAFPTWPREPFAFAPLEAARRGCVPIIPRACGNAEWMLDGVHVLKVPRTAEAYANMFTAIMRGEVELGPIRMRAAAMLERDFHLDRLLPRIEAALEAAARRSRFDPAPAGRIYARAVAAQRRSQRMAYRKLSA